MKIVDIAVKKVVCRKDRYITWSDLRKKIVYEGSQE